MAVANIRCPSCGHIQKIEVPQTSCLQFYKCNKCGRIISTPKGSCCVICAYSDTKCPVSAKV
ncbi:MAG: GDCCVxC domain-containing (seleno)protein [Candidatus Hadarchaeota archaeon]